MTLPLENFPALNAVLNSTSAFFLLLGFYFVKTKRIPAHKFCMVCAAIASTLFLACYLYYHYHHGSTRYPKHDWTRPVYFTILLTHTILAVVNLPLILKTLWHTLKGDFARHKTLARWTFPIWLYVSVTGVVIYLMLYRF